MQNNYNKVAPYYDRISRLVFQRSIIKAQQYLIDFICDNYKVLVVGGGTGWILEEITKLNRKNVSVVYVERSAKMIDLSKKRKTGNLKVDFVNESVEKFKTDDHFDIILTPFLFDNFVEKRISYVFNKLDALLKPKGIWLHADFVNNKENKKRWQQYMLKTMYTFFSITTNIEAQELIDVRPYFSGKYEMITEQYYYKRFILATAFRKFQPSPIA